MFLSFPLKLLNVVIQTVEALLPDVAVVLGPVGYFFQWASFNPATPPLGVPPLRDQPGALQHPEVLRDSRHAHREGLGKFAYRAFAGHKPGQDSPASRVREGGEGVIDSC